MLRENYVAFYFWISKKSVVIGDSSSAFIYNPPTLASAADPITALVIFASTYTGPLNCVPSQLPK